ARARGGGGDPARGAVAPGPVHPVARRRPAAAGDRGRGDRSETSGTGGARRTAAPSPPRCHDLPAGGRSRRGGGGPQGAGRGRGAPRAAARARPARRVTRLGARAVAPAHLRATRAGGRRRRTSRLIRALKPETLRRLVEMGGDFTQRRKFVHESTDGMAVDAVLEIVQAAADSSHQTISHSLVRMLSKLAAHAEGGAPQVR